MSDSLIEQILQLKDDAARAEERRLKALERLDSEYKSSFLEINNRRRDAESLTAAQNAARRAQASNEIARKRRQFEAQMKAMAKEQAQTEQLTSEALKELQKAFERLPNDYCNGATFKDVRLRALGSRTGNAPWHEPSDLEKLFEIVEDRSFLSAARRLLGASEMSPDEAAKTIIRVIANDCAYLAQETERRNKAAKSAKEEAEQTLEAEISAIEASAAEEVAFDQSAFNDEIVRLNQTYGMNRSRLEQNRAQERQLLDSCEQLIADHTRGMLLSSSEWLDDYRPASEVPRFLPQYRVKVEVSSNMLVVPVACRPETPTLLWFDGCPKERTMSGLRAMVATQLRIMPPGTMEFLWLDPVGKGRSLGKLAALAQSLELRDSSLPIKVATSATATEKALLEVDARMGEIGLSLSGYSSLRDYVEKNPEGKRIPFTTIIVGDIDSGLYDNREINLLQLVIENARALGIQVLVVDGNQDCEDKAVEKLRKESKPHFTVFKQHGETLTCSSYNESETDLLDEGVVTERFIDDYRARAVRAAALANEAHVEQRDYDICQGVKIPIGHTEAGTPVALNFGPDYVHAIVTGSTGSGKTVFLQNVINSACTHYSPSELNLWVIDYKRTEFSFFKQAEYRYPHITFLGLDTSMDFVDGFVGYMEQELDRRQRLFMEAGDKNTLEGYNKAVPESERLPRLLIIIDEFHRQSDSMCDGNGDTKQMFEEFLRESRSYGMNVIIADQTLTRLNGLSPAARKQMGGRVLLKWEESDEVSEMFDNPGDVKSHPIEPGQAYTDVFGQIVKCDVPEVSRDQIKVTVGRMGDLQGVGSSSNGFLCYDGSERPVLSSGMIESCTEEGLFSIGEVPNFREPVLSFSLRRRRRESIFVFDAVEEITKSIVGALSLEASSMGMRISMLSDADAPLLNDNRPFWTQLMRAVGGTIIDDPLAASDYVCAESVENNLIICIGLDELVEAMDDEGPEKGISASEGGLHTKKKSYDELYQMFIEESPAASDSETITRAPSEALLTLMYEGGLKGNHVCWVSETPPNLRRTFPNVDAQLLKRAGNAVNHTFAAKCSKSVSAELGMGSKASSIPFREQAYKAVYVDRLENAVEFRPFDISSLITERKEWQ